VKRETLYEVLVMTNFLIAAVAYLLGSIPFGFLLVRVFRGTDVRRSGSGNIGATNVARTSPLLGIATLVLDGLKGALAVVIGTYLTRSSMQAWTDFRTGFPNVAGMDPQLIYKGAILAALFAVLGHMFPLWLRFRGGKGVATALGAFLVLAPKAVLAFVGIFRLVFAVFRYVSLGSIVAIALFPVLAWLLHRQQVDAFSLVCMAIASALIIAKHRDNIRRLSAGAETRFSLRRG